MLRVVADELIAPFIERRPELRGAAGGFKFARHGMKAKVCAANQHCRMVRLIGRSDFAIVGVVRGINPVINPQPQIRDARFGIHFGKAGVQHFARVRFAIAVVVFHIQNVGRTGDKQTAFPRQKAADFQDLIGKDRGLFILAVAVHIFEQANARTCRFAGRRIVRVIEHFRDI